MIPHVTQFDEADITELEALRVQLNKENAKTGDTKLTMLAFLVKDRSSRAEEVSRVQRLARRREPDPEALLPHRLRGGHAEWPGGAGDPRRRQKGPTGDRQEMAALSAKAREGKLGPANMQGGCFSISSLGGIGGTAFTPIVNAPEVAILGVSKTQTKPVWDGKAFQPRA
jgi:pyruvate dehydrogenase E2 component (dihydrolipoamide acetyltransferase)